MLSHTLRSRVLSERMTKPLCIAPSPLSTSSTIPLRLHYQPHRPYRFYSSTPMAAPTDTAALETASQTHQQITPESLTATLQSKLPNTSHIEIQDMSGGCGQAFNAIIVSSEFEKKGALARHRLVNAALKQEIAAIHAWTPRCLTPEQWEKEKEKEREG